jgi:nicotinate-nucleotide pyrophosphorylase (carboxylating)
VIAPIDYERLVRAALAEDAPYGDPFGASFRSVGRALFLSRSEGVFCGGPVGAEAFRQLSPDVSVRFVDEGSRVDRDATVGEASGPMWALLRGERVALNFIQRLSGIATVTSRHVAIAAPFGTRILDTRKTTPLLRVLEKYAVRTGGGVNHRNSLSDGVLIKENGIRAAGGIGPAVAAARSAVHHLCRVEVEVETLAEAEEAVHAGADGLLLDNMAPGLVREVVLRYEGKLFLEASGGITLDNLESYARTGIPNIAVGALTHSAPAFDISFEIVD